MNQPPAGGAAGPGQGMQQGPGNQQSQEIQQLRQMDHEQLVMLAYQLLTRVKQLQSALQQTQGGSPGGQPQGQPPQGQPPMR